MRRWLSFLLLPIFSNLVSAADWELSYFGQQQTSGTFISSPQAHCSSINGMIANLQSGKTYHSAKFEGYLDNTGNLTSDMSKVTGARCTFQNPNYISPWYAAYKLIKPSCDDGSVRDEATGECKGPEPDKCEAKAGQSDNFIVAGLQFKMCRDNCELALDGVQPFKRTASSETLYHFFGVYTGESCQTNTSIVPSVSPPEATESDQNKECTATSVTTDAEGRRHETSSCTTTTTDIDNQACIARGGSVGTFNGVMTCVNKGNGPKATETKKEVKQETKQNPDGSKTETKTTTTTVTTCAGANSCSTSTTTTTETTNTNADGTSGGSSSSCRGANCGTDGKEGNGKGKGDGDGNGSDDGVCDPATDYCGQAPTAQLKKGEQGNFEQGNTEWDERVSELKDELEQKLEQYRNQFKGLFDLGFGGGGGSLPCDRTTLSHGATVSYCISDFSDSLVWFRYALLLGAAVIAAFVVLRD
ncbi:hypothetical protein [Pseudomonas sp. Marseille-Q8238]